MNSRLLRTAVASAFAIASLAGASSAAAAPTIGSEWVSGVTERDAVLNAEINPNGAAATYFFEIDTIRSDNFTHPNCPFGPCASITAGPPLPDGLTEPPSEEVPSGTGERSVSVDMARIGAILQPGTTYFYRVVAHQARSYGSPTAYGPEQSFTTLSPSPALSPSPTNPAPHRPRHKHHRHKHRHHHHRRHGRNGRDASSSP